jgi:hypothetical protein
MMNELLKRTYEIQSFCSVRICKGQWTTVFLFNQLIVQERREFMIFNDLAFIPKSVKKIYIKNLLLLKLCEMRESILCI